MDHYEHKIADLEEALELAEKKIAELTPKTIYLMDDDEADLQHLQTIIPDTWLVYEHGYYIDEDAGYEALPPFGVPIILKRISEQ